MPNPSSISRSVLATSILLIPLAANATESLTTTFAGGNGQKGITFDLNSTTNIRLQSFDLNLTNSTAQNLTVYYRVGTSSGNELNASGWVLLGTPSVTGAGSGNPTAVSVSTLKLLANTTYGFLVHSDNGVQYSNGSTQYTNGTVTLVPNKGISGIFTGSTFSPRIFNGTIYYGPATSVYDSSSLLNNSIAFSAARAIDATPGLLSLFDNLNSDREVSNAAKQTLPLLTGGTTATVRSTMNVVNGIVQARLDHVNGRASGDSFLGDRNVWLKPFASRAEQDNRNGVAGYTADTYGLAGGVDGTLSPALRIGGAFAYAASDVNGKSSDAPQSNDVAIYQLIGYGNYALDDRTDIHFQADVGQNTNKGRRQIAFTSSVASSNYDSQTAHVGVGIGRSYALSGSTTLTPSVRADYTWIKDMAYNETGAGLLNLNVASRSTDALVVGIDGKLSHQLNDQTTLIANLGVGYDTINKQDAITASFAGAANAAFVTYGINPSPWIGRGGVGAVHKLKNGFEITGRYDVEYRESFLNQSASANLRWAF